MELTGQGDLQHIVVASGRIFLLAGRFLEGWVRVLTTGRPLSAGGLERKAGKQWRAKMIR